MSTDETKPEDAAGPAATVDLIIPARNEAANIGALLASLPWSHLRHVVVADNASSDRTATLAREGGAVVVQEPHRGYGAACLAGLCWISQCDPLPDIVAFLDADRADDPSYLPGLCRPIVQGEADMVIGARRFAEPGSLTVTQRFGNRLSCWMIRLLTSKQYTDLGPMRAVRYGALSQMQMRDRTWGWTVEMQYKAAAMRLRTLDIDVPYRRRQAGHSEISGTWIGSARAGAKIIWTILRLWAEGGGAKGEERRARGEGPR